MSKLTAFCRRTIISQLAMGLLLLSQGLAQPALTTLPDGSSIKGTLGGGEYRIHYNDNSLWTQDAREGIVKRFTPPPGKTIVSIQKKGAGRHPSLPPLFVILLSDGSIYTITIDVTSIFTWVWTIPHYSGKVSTSADTDGLKDFLYDDMYALRFYVWVSRDDGLTWKIDTLGLSGATVVQMALDTAGNVLAATSSKGLFKQGRTDSVWIKNATLTPTTLTSTYVDRLNRIFVGSTTTGVFISTDNGTSWNPLSTGMSKSVSKFGDDAFANIYAITDAGKHVYRSTGGNQAWSLVDAPIRTLAVDTSAQLFNDVNGDTTLRAATAFGLFTSTNQGGTWTHQIQGFQSTGLKGFMNLPSGRLLGGTDLGAYFLDPGSSTWTKAFPTSGFVSMGNFQRDNLGNIFSLGGKVIYKSTDQGTTWTEDNTGLVSIGGDGFIYIDEMGVQHYVRTNFSNPAGLYIRNGGIWTSDVVGIPGTGSPSAMALQSDMLGNLFAAISFPGGGARAWRRPIAGGTWVADTSGLGSKTPYALTRYRNGDIIAGCINGGMFRRKAATWTPVTTPSSISTTDPYLLSVDSAGALYAAFRGFSNFVRVWSGVYVSVDTGLTWQYAGLDSMEISSLISSGDTTYAVTGRGLFLLSRNVTTPVLTSPANGATNIARDTVLSWSWTLGATSYRLQVSTSAAFSTTLIDTSGLTASSRRVSGLAGNTIYYWRVAGTGPGGTSAFSAARNFTTTSATDVGDLDNLPTEFALSQNYPNPFNPSTTIKFDLPAAAQVRLRVFDLLGREVALLVNEERNAGRYQVQWNASKVSSGIYFYRLEAGGFVAVRKLVLLK